MRLGNYFMSFSIIALSVASASGAIVVDGYEWDHAYTGDVLPDDALSTPQWTKVESGGSALLTLGGGELTIDTTNVTSTRYRLPDGSAWDPANEQTSWVQFRMKVNSQKATQFAAGFYLGGGTGAHARRIDLNIGSLNGGGVSNSSYQLIASLDVTQWHTYRVAFNLSDNTYRLWIDDFAATPYTGALIGFGGFADQLTFGGLHGDARGSSTWDYVAWNNSHAPVAVPEPALLSVMGMMGLVARRRRG